MGSEDSTMLRFLKVTMLLLFDEETREKLRFLLTYLRDNGQRACFKYIKKHLRKKIEIERLKEQA
jgi:hypothetical protein